MHIDSPHGGPAPSTGGQVPLGNPGEVGDIVSQARGRADGFQYGEDRAIGDQPNWAAHDSQQLYNYATVNNVPGTAEELSHRWGGHGRDLTHAADDLYNAITELGAAWIGQGAGAAQGSLIGIANSSSQAAEAAQAMSNRCSRQAAAAAEVKKMPQPQEFDPAREMAGMLGGGPAMMTRDMRDQFEAARETKAQQIAYLQEYTRAMSDIDHSTPSFGPESLGLTPFAGGTGAGAGNVGAVSGVAGVGAGAGIGHTPVSLHGLEGTQAAAQAHGAGGGVMAGPPGAPHAPGGQAPLPQAPAAGTGAGAGAPPAAPSAGGGPSFAQGLGAAVAGGAVGYAGARALSKGKRSGASNEQQSSEEQEHQEYQEGTAASGSESAAMAPSATPHQQAPGVISPTGMVGGGQAGAVPPAAPMGGMGAAGAGGQGQQDEEHTHASFLIEEDPDEVFGATEATPPPVLGAWGPDEER